MTKRKPDARPYIRKSPGDRFGRITLIEMCGPGLWLCRCDCGNTLRVQSGSLASRKGCGRGECNHWYAEHPTYRTAHDRVRRARGKATEQVCGCGSPARAWAYDHSDPDELLDPESASPYSGDPAHYEPLCLPCHRERDNAERRALRRRIKELEEALANALS